MIAEHGNLPSRKHDYVVSLNSLPTLPNQKEIIFLIEIMDAREGESEWSLTEPAHYPSEARAVRVDSREINQIW